MTLDKTLEKYLGEKLAKIPWKSAQAVMALVAEGGTVPFIARYRKEKTNNLDEVAIRDVIDAHSDYEELIKRKEFILKEIQEQGNLSEDLKLRIQKCWDLGEIEELYRPYKKKKKSKGTIARDAGIGPLADWIWSLGQGEDAGGLTLEMKAKEFINPMAKFVTYDEVLRGAMNILVEKIANITELRQMVRDNLFKVGTLDSKPGKKVKAKSKYETYFAHNEKVTSLLEKKNSHRYLAMRRGWKEGELTIIIASPDEEKIIADFASYASPKDSVAKNFLTMTAKTALSVHVQPSITNEVHKKLKDSADIFAIEVFAENVKKLLLASPFGSRCVLGIDPGIRTGCKVALVDNKGAFISHTVLKIQGEGADKNAKTLFSEVLKQIEIDAVAVGNGTGGREAEAFLRKVLKDLEKDIPVVLVNEAGASIYSASDVAREEFPDLDLTVRGAISIARRLQDPLAELVKIEPKSIGVGQYQHDVAQSTLKKRLENVVEHCVNHVGVNINTASAHLLQHVSGIGPGIAKNIVTYRQEKGLFKSRQDINNVPQFSSKTYEQAAGFLRIPGGDVALDATGIHPERYAAVKDMAKELNIKVTELMGDGAPKVMELKEKWSKLIGEFTFDDIVVELKKPGRDPRDAYKVFQFRADIFKVDDLKDDMICNGIVSNVTNFGAFVDIGVHQDGLVHISEIANQFVDDPQKMLSPGDQIQVKVKKVDKEKNQIALTMKFGDAAKPAVRKTSGKKRVSFKDDKKGSRPPRRGKDGRPQRKGGSNTNHKPRRPSKPFNNPFAALQGIKSEDE